MATASLRTVLEELNRRGFAAPKNPGSVCRAKKVNGKLRPDLGWSQHAYANAVDLSNYDGLDQQRPVVAALESMRLQGFPVGLILWAQNRPNDHDDHIHLEGSPSLTGTPACAGGTEKPLSDEDTGTFERITGEDPEQGGLENTGGNVVSDFFLGLFGLEQDALADLGIRVVFGLLAVLAAGATLLLVVNAFKGNVIKGIAGAVKDVVS